MPGLSLPARLAAVALIALAVCAGVMSVASVLQARYLGARVEADGFVRAVEAGGPADVAGLKVGDNVRRIGDVGPQRLARPQGSTTIALARARADSAGKLAGDPRPVEVALEGGRTLEIPRESVPLPRLVLSAAPVWLATAIFIGIGLLLLWRGRPRRGFPVALGLTFLAVPIDQLGSGAVAPLGAIAPLGLPLLALNLCGHLCSSLGLLVLFARYPRLDTERGLRPRLTLLAIAPGLALALAGLATGHLGMIRAGGVLWGVAALGFLAANLRGLQPDVRERLSFVLWATVLLLPLSIAVEIPESIGVELHVPRIVLGLAVALIPASFGLAFVEHRLFDVERVTRGTLTWVLLSIGVALTFFAGTAGLESLLPDPGKPYLRTALAVLVAVSLRPGHTLAQRLVDRVFFRGRFDHQRHLDQLGEQLASAEDMGHVAAAVDRLLEATVRTEAHALSLEVPEDVAATREIVSRTGADGESLDVPLLAGRRLEGVLRLSPRRAARTWGRADRRLLQSASVPIALALGRLRTVRELATANEALRRSLAELEGLQERLVRQERLAALGEMSSAIVHEIRHPLGIMGMGLHMLMRHAEDLSRDALQEIARIQAAHGDASEVIRVVQKVSKDLQVVAAPWSAGELVSESVSGMGDVAAERGIEVEIEVAAELPPVSADRRTLTQALGILLRNAVEASPDRARVKVHVSGKGPIRFEVRDEGAGIPPRDRERIFEPFFTTKPQGMGLGLAYARKVAQAHGGALILEPSERGACFVLSVPAWSGPGEALPARRRLRSA